MLRKDSEALGNTSVTFTNQNNVVLTGRFLAWHEKLVAWEQNRHEFSINRERAVSSYEKQGFRQLDENSVKIWNSLPEEKIGGDGEETLPLIAVGSSSFPRNSNGSKHTKTRYLGALRPSHNDSSVELLFLNTSAPSFLPSSTVDAGRRKKLFAMPMCWSLSEAHRHTLWLSSWFMFPTKCWRL
uniref:Uncharacterized protein n=1 Tax=Prunus yedoensis var. nudiflora TaxID=2094558 RepID=A0A314Y6L5_PRUYE|nr:hypothetical protein Pyn_08750 [Prunus yedoensis var. nudiflora]